MTNEQLIHELTNIIVILTGRDAPTARIRTGICAITNLIDEIMGTESCCGCMNKCNENLTIENILKQSGRS